MIEKFRYFMKLSFHRMTQFSYEKLVSNFNNIYNKYICYFLCFEWKYFHSLRNVPIMYLKLLLRVLLGTTSTRIFSVYNTVHTYIWVMPLYFSWTKFNNRGIAYTVIRRKLNYTDTTIVFCYKRKGHDRTALQIFLSSVTLTMKKEKIYSCDVLDSYNKKIAIPVI